MAKIYRVAVVLGTDVAYGRQLLRGILKCPRHPYHVLFTPWPVDAQIIPHLGDWQPDGIIANLNHLELAEGIRSFGVPTVSIAENYPEIKQDLPRVGLDDHAVGEMAAHYLLQQGFKNFGFAHYRNYTRPAAFPFSVDRYAGFSQTLKRAGFPNLSVSDQPHNHDRWPKPYLTDNPEERWLRALPQPVGIMAANDIVGARLLDSCVHANLRVPEDIAVLSVDNDDLVCLMSEVVLSSIETPTEQVGLQAMSLMKRLLGGETLAQQPILLPPLRVVERHSSDKLAVDDECLAAAVRYIRNHISEPLGVDEIAEAIMVSRRQLEMRFRAVMHQSPAEQIRQERFDQARRMLAETDLPVTEIALRVGLNRAGLLSVLFREKCQMTPTAYREKFRQTAIQRAIRGEAHSS